MFRSVITSSFLFTHAFYALSGDLNTQRHVTLAEACSRSHADKALPPDPLVSYLLSAKLTELTFTTADLRMLIEDLHEASPTRAGLVLRLKHEKRNVGKQFQLLLLANVKRLTTQELLQSMNTFRKSRLSMDIVADEIAYEIKKRLRQKMLSSEETIDSVELLTSVNYYPSTNFLDTWITAVEENIFAFSISDLQAVIKVFSRLNKKPDIAFIENWKAALNLALAMPITQMTPSDIVSLIMDHAILDIPVDAQTLQQLVSQYKKAKWKFSGGDHFHLTLAAYRNTAYLSVFDLQPIVRNQVVSRNYDRSDVNRRYQGFEKKLQHSFEDVQVAVLLPRPGITARWIIDSHFVIRVNRRQDIMLGPETQQLNGYSAYTDFCLQRDGFAVIRLSDKKLREEPDESVTMVKQIIDL